MLKAGQSVGAWTIREVLAFHDRGGLYRLDDSRLLKEMFMPDGLSQEVIARRRDRLREALLGWKRLKHRLAIPILEERWEAGRVFLLLPELPGHTLQVEARLRQAPPDSPTLVRWADELSEFVQRLWSEGHPLAGEVLRSDRILVDEHKTLTCFNPGWTRLLWNEPEPLSLPDILRGYGELLVEMGSGDVRQAARFEDLPAGITWIASRCLSREAGRAYQDFGQVRKALRAVAVEGEQRQLGQLPPIRGFRLPAWQALRNYHVSRMWLVAAVLVAVLALVLVPERVALEGPALVLAQQRKLWVLQPSGRARAWGHLPAEVRSMASRPDGKGLYLAAGNLLWELDVTTQSLRDLGTDGETSWLATDSNSLTLWQCSGRFLRLHQRDACPRNALQTEPGLVSTVQVSLPNQGMGLVTAHPRHGLALYDLCSGRLLHQRTTKAYQSLLWPGGKRAWLLAASSNGELDALDLQLKPLKRITLPAREGLVQLHSAGGGRFWTLQASSAGTTSVGYWDADTLQCLRKQAIPVAWSGAACVDAGSALCWADPAGRIWSVSPDSRVYRELGRIGGTVKAMVYLPPWHNKPGLQRILDQNPY